MNKIGTLELTETALMVVGFDRYTPGKGANGLRVVREQHVTLIDRRQMTPGLYAALKQLPLNERVEIQSGWTPFRASNDNKTSAGWFIENGSSLQRLTFSILRQASQVSNYQHLYRITSAWHITTATLTGDSRDAVSQISLADIIVSDPSLEGCKA